MNWQRAKVRWFDNLTGIGVVRLEDDTCVKVHYSAIFNEWYEPGQHLTFFHRMLWQGQEVEVRIFEDSDFRQVQEVK